VTEYIESLEVLENEKMSCLVDWLSFTIQDTLKNNVDSIITDILKIDKDKFVELKTGHYGYKSQRAYDQIRIYSDGRHGMGIHIQMSGSGCRLFEKEYPGTWKEFLISIQGANISRLDLAIDEKDGLLDLELMINKARKREIISKFRYFDYRCSWMTEFDNEGLTLYCGSNTSDIKFRIYDKAFEQAVKIESNISEKSFLKGYGMKFASENKWIRFEIQFRNEMALQMYNTIISSTETDFFGVTAGIIKDKLRFIEQSESDTNKRRWEESLFWTKFLEGVERLKLSRNPSKKTLEESLGHFKKQYAPSLAMYLIYFGGNIDEIIKIATEGRERLSNKHYEMLNSCDLVTEKTPNMFDEIESYESLF